MNFLAHSVLAFGDNQLLAGQFAGDFVRGSDLSAFPDQVAAGIRLHRRADAFTDRHPAVVAARRRFDPTLRRHASIIIDVIFDHLLARNWAEVEARELTAHARWVDSALSEQANVLPESLRRFAAFIASDRTLERNVDIAAVAQTLQRLSRRSASMAPLALAVPVTASLADMLGDSFQSLWPELEGASREWMLDMKQQWSGQQLPDGSAEPVGTLLLGSVEE